MTRKLNDWLSSYIQFTKETEPPLSFHTWCGVSIIASTIQRRCRLVWGHDDLYSNHYIILIGPSGQTRKGAALSIARPFLDYIGIPIAANRVTNEKLCRFIADSCSSFNGPNNEVKLQCATTIWSSELHVFLGRANTDLLAALTDWYDCLDDWEYDTKNQGRDEISGLCVNMLGATAPDWLPSMLPHEAVGGGFTSRIILVVEEHKGKVVLDPNEVGVDEELKEELLKDLEQIKLLCGDFTMEAEALETYKRWYGASERRIKLGRFAVPDPKFAGYCSRRATHIKKLAMVLSVSRGDDLVIRLEDFNRAKVLMEAAEKKMPRAFSGLGRARFSDLTDGILSYIMQRRKCLRSELLQKFYRDVDAWTLEQIERVLEQMKVVKVVRLTEENDAEYTFIGGKKDDKRNEDEDAAGY